MMLFLPIFLSMVSKTEAEDCYQWDRDGSDPTRYECKLIGQIKLFVAAFWIAALAVLSYIIFSKPKQQRI